MRRCRHCRQEFEPTKPYYYYCSWPCRVADVGPNYEGDARGHQRSYDNAYDRGFNDGLRSGPMNPGIPAHIWKVLACLVHPDRWEDAPALKTIAHEAMVWLNAHRPR
jgi:hypothetical protein